VELATSELESAKTAWDQARVQVRRAAIDAVVNGVPVSQVARTLGVSRNVVMAMIDDTQVDGEAVW
jgi:transposase-like protein